MPIRVLHCIHSMNRGGAETFIMNVYRKIDRSRVQFDFLLHNPEPGDYDEEIRQLGGHIYYAPSRRDGIIENRRALNRFFKEHTEFAAAHQHLSSCSYIEPLRYAKKHGIKIRIAHSHSTKEDGSRLHELMHRLQRPALRRIATHLWACSDLSAVWTYGPHAKNKIINNGIQTDSFCYDAEKRQLFRKQYGIEDAFCIGLVGRFVPAKNHSRLLAIFDALQKKHSQAVLMLVGVGPLMDEAKKETERRELTGRVIITGISEGIAGMMSAMDVFVMPSLFEGLPVTLVEAQATGLPCIVSDVITRDVALTDYIHYLPLSMADDIWCEKILEYTKWERPEDAALQVKRRGFDIQTTVQNLEDTYLGR